MLFLTLKLGLQHLLSTHKILKHTLELFASVLLLIINVATGI